MTTFKKRLLLWLMLMLGFVSVSAYQLLNSVSLQADILSVLPDSGYSKPVNALVNKQAEPLQRQVNFLLGHQRLETLLKQQQTFKQKLAKHIQFDQPISQNQLVEDVSQLFASGYFLSNSYQRLLQNNKESAIIQQAKQLLMMPGNSLVSDALTHDPLLLSVNFQMQMKQTTGLSFQQKQQFEHNDKQYIQISGLLNNQGTLSSQIEQINTLLEQFIVRHPNTELIKSGFAFHAAAAEKRAKQEMTWLGGAAIVAIITLVFFVFYSLMPLLLSAVCVISAMVTGTLALTLIYPSIHILTFVFAVSLIGIAIDYSFHFFVHRQDKTNDSVFYKALTSSLITTILGYCLLFLSPLQLLAQVAIFMITGMLTAYSFIYWVARKCHWYQQKESKTGLQLKSVYQKLSPDMKHRNWIASVMMLVFLSFLVLLNTQSVFKDDIRLLTQADTALIAQEQSYRALTENSWETQYILSYANNEQKLLTQLKQLNASLLHLKRQQDVKAYVNLEVLLPTVTQQEHNQSLLKKLRNSDSYQKYIQLFDYKPDQMNSFYQGKDPYLVQDFLNLPLSSTTQHLWLTIKEANSAPPLYGAITLLQNVNNWPAIETVIAEQDKTQLIDRPQAISDVLQNFRQSLIFIIAAILLLASLYLSVVFGLKKALYSMSIIVTSLIAALLFSYVLIGYLNIFNFFGCLLIVALGLDYVIFYMHKLALNKVQLAIVLSSISTLLGFGLLAFSSTPAVSSFGLTVMLGIISLSLLTPSIRLNTRSSTNT